MRPVLRVMAVLVLGLLPISASWCQAKDDFATVFNNHMAEYAKLRDDRKLTTESFKNLLDQTVEKINFNTITIKQSMQLVLNGFTSSKNFGTKLAPRLKTLENPKTADGVLAKTLQIVVKIDNAPTSAKAGAEMKSLLLAALTNPSVKNVVNSEDALFIFLPTAQVLSRYPDGAKPYLEKTLGLIGSVNNDVTGPKASAIIRYFEVADTAYEKQPALRERTRLAILSVLERGLKSAKDENLKSYLSSNIELYKSPSMTGKLIGRPAPQIDIIWSSTGTLKSISELKGKVVVLDFFATWCGPCIKSFPEIKKLQEFYKDKPVVIVGITSIQGTHYGAKGTIDCKGKPEKEEELMRSFMTEKDMTWTVTFSKQNVFNPDFGIRGIPHMAIIDAQGKVRDNSINPAAPLEEKTKFIDTLLKEIKS